MDYSLPYCTTIDQIHEDYEEYALSLIEDEMKQITARPLERDMKDIKYRTPLMKQEYKTLFQPNTTTDGQDQEDVENNLTYVPRENVATVADFDTTPPPKRPKLDKSGGSSNSKAEADRIIKDWKLQALSYARSKYEAERIRSINLDVEKYINNNSSNNNGKKGTPSSNWKQYIEQTLHDIEKQYSDKLHKQRDVVDEINYQRQSSQERIYGPQLQQYISEYQQLVFTRNTLEYNIYKKKNEKEENNEKDESNSK